MMVSHYMLEVCLTVECPSCVVKFTFSRPGRICVEVGFDLYACQTFLSCYPLAETVVHSIAPARYLCLRITLSVVNDWYWSCYRKISQSHRRDIIVSLPSSPRTTRVLEQISASRLLCVPTRAIEMPLFPCRVLRGYLEPLSAYRRL